MSNVISNCCGAYPTSQNDIDSDMCPKCFEHCEWLDEDKVCAEDKADQEYNFRRENNHDQ